MVLKSKENSIGAWAFLVGVVLAVIIGVFTVLLPIPAVVDNSGKIYGALVIIGIIVGSMITTGKDSQTFLLTSVILVIASKFGMESVGGSLIGLGISASIMPVFSALLSLFVPATIIVSLKTLFSIAKV